jgi:hypothetical protein
MPGGAGARRSYIAWFDNSAGLVKAGDKVSLIIDEYRIDDLTVR